MAQFAVSSLFPAGHEGLLRSCPLASASWLHVQVPADWQENFTLAVNISRPHRHDALAHVLYSLSCPPSCRARAYVCGYLWGGDLGARCRTLPCTSPTLHAVVRSK
jgi:hypothetical protein